jgi:hypothetical protein
VLNVSGKVKILDLLKGGIALVEVSQHYGKNKSSIHGTALSSKHSEHSWFFLSGSLLGTIYLQYKGLTMFFLFLKIFFYMSFLFIQQIPRLKILTQINIFHTINLKSA